MGILGFMLHLLLQLSHLCEAGDELKKELMFNKYTKENLLCFNHWEAEGEDLLLTTGILA
jgi:hypothetical protein